MGIEIIFENKDIVVINKPSGIDSQNSKETRKSVVSWLEDKYKFKGLVHRLDFNTTGVMVCAKNSLSAKKLTENLDQFKWRRIYRGVCLGVMNDNNGKINTELTEDDGKTISAITHFKVLERFRNATYLEIELETGRKHQIRRHFSLINHPLLGEHRYGKSQAKLLFKRPALHSFQLILDGKIYEAPIPNDMLELFKRLRGK